MAVKLPHFLFSYVFLIILRQCHLLNNRENAATHFQRPAEISLFGQRSPTFETND